MVGKSDEILAPIRPFLPRADTVLGAVMDRDQEPIALLSVSTPRRLFGAATQGGLGVLLIAVAMRLPEPSVPGVIALIAFGVLALALAHRSYQATARDLILTRRGLYDSTGEELARIDDIVSVDRGFFAFKPSNGFLLRRKTPGPRRWLPGLWWRMGTRVGVGGATNGKAAREMADLIMLLQKGMLPGYEDVNGPGPDQE